MAPNTIRIDEVEYVRKDSLNATEGDIKIVVLDKGFVYVGTVEVTDDFIIITNAKNVRQWGTTKGLGELVSGPLSGTKLDQTGTVRVAARALISLIDVDQTAWKSL